MTKIETKQQYDWAVERVEELLQVVNEDTPTYSPQYIELDLLSNLVADYSDEHFAIGKPTLIEVKNYTAKLPYKAQKTPFCHCLQARC